MKANSKHRVIETNASCKTPEKEVQFAVHEGEVLSCDSSMESSVVIRRKLFHGAASLPDLVPVTSSVFHHRVIAADTRWNKRARQIYVCHHNVSLCHVALCSLRFQI